MLNPEPVVTPDHIPKELIQEFPLVMGAFTDENPFTRIVPEACEGPDAIYASNALPVGMGGAWLFRRQEDMKLIYNDTEHFTNKGFTPYAKVVGESWELVPAEQDPPQHTFYRLLLAPMFSPKAINALEKNIRQIAIDCIATFKDNSECDFVKEFTSRYPIAVVLNLLALPIERLEEFLQWEALLLQAATIEDMQDGVRKVTGYLREVIKERQANPGEDLISFAINAEVNGKKMTDDELLGYAFNFFIGGLDTVTANLGNFFRHFAEDQDNQRILREDPSKIRIAIEELLRVFGPVTTVRVCSKETTIAGVTLKPGDAVWMCTTTANRDADTYDEPHAVKLDRNPMHVSFASGPHHCLGVRLARLEFRVAMEEVFKAIPQFRLKQGAKISSSLGPVIQPMSLPITWA
ncbi:MAG: cytochrome P450 [Spongiibacteraceae bacterium]